MILLLQTIDALSQAQPQTETEPQLLGETQRGWLSCWKKSDRYKGTGRIVWDYAAKECTEIMAPISEGLGNPDEDFLRNP